MDPKHWSLWAPLRVGLPFSDEKIIPWNTEQTAVPSEFRLFRGREKPTEFRSEPFLGRDLNPSRKRKTLRIPFRTISQKRNTLGIPFRTIYRKGKPSEFRSEPFSEEKNPRNSVPNHFWMRKTSEFRSEPFSEEKKLSNSILNQFSKTKTSEKDDFC